VDRKVLGKIFLLAGALDLAVAGMLLGSRDEMHRILGQALLPIAPAWLILGVRLLARG